MRCLLLVWALLLLVAAPSMAQSVPDDPDEALIAGRKAKAEGLSCLKKARAGEGDSKALSRKALKLLDYAHACYESYIDAKGETPEIDDEMSELQSLLYWTRKMTPMASEEEEEESPKPREKEPKRERPSDRPPATSPDTKAKTLFESAEKFERQNPDALFAISARYFEIVDKYRDSSYAIKAYERCMAYQRKLMARQKRSKIRPETTKKSPRKPLDQGSPPSTDLTLIRIGLRHPHPDIRKANTVTLFDILHRKACSEFHRMFTEETHPKVLGAVYSCLAKLHDPMTMRFAGRKADVKDAATAEKLVRLSQVIGKSEYVRILMKVIGTNCQRCVPGKELLYVVRGEQGHIPPYAADVKSVFSYGLRRQVIEAIEKMGKEGITGLKKCLKGTTRVTCEAILCTGILKQKKMSGKLSVFLQRKNRFVYRTEALAALFIIGADAVPYLIKNLRSSALRNWSAYLLREITGKEWGMNDTKKFMAWYRANKR
jgi:hypothetical protein